MKITKYEHACIVIEEQGKKLVIDPGDFSESLPEINDVVAVVITHVHFDHLNKDRVSKILAANPRSKFLSVQQVKDEVPMVSVVAAGHKEVVGPYTLEFFGKQHAIIHPDYPKFENTGVKVNGSFYYGGDSLDKPDGGIKVLAVPVSGPWSKVGEVMDYLVAVKPEIVIPTHDYLNSEAGNKTQDSWLARHCGNHKIRYQRLMVGESIEI